MGTQSETEHDDADWSEVPDVLKSYVISFLRKERAALLATEAEQLASNRVMIDGMGEVMRAAVAAGQLNAEEMDVRMQAMMGSMGGGMAKMQEAITAAKIAAFDSAISNLDRPVSS